MGILFRSSVVMSKRSCFVQSPFRCNRSTSAAISHMLEIVVPSRDILCRLPEGLETGYCKSENVADSLKFVLGCCSSDPKILVVRHERMESVDPEPNVDVENLDL